MFERWLNGGKYKFIMKYYTIYMSYKIDPNSQFCLTTYLEPQIRSNCLLKNSIWAQSILLKNSTRMHHQHGVFKQIL